MVGVEWYEAVLFCRWLTEQAGMPESEQCYPPHAAWKGDASGLFANVVCAPQRGGFRLPSEAEWEYACRGGTVTPYGFGSDRGLLPRYAWILCNSGRQAHVPGLLPPSRRGLFDLHGNVLEWCDDIYRPYVEEPGKAVPTQKRVLRGGAWSSREEEARSAFRKSEIPNQGSSSYGFRVARTLPADGAADEVARP